MYAYSCGILRVAAEKAVIQKRKIRRKENSMGKTITELTAGKQEQRILRLAPYTRVSSNSEDQLHSFAAQVKYYTEYAATHPEYELMDIYADEGITGTRMDKRDDFNRLIRSVRKERSTASLPRPSPDSH